MGERYSGTAVPFGAMSLREIRDPVTAGTGTESMNAAADALDSVARRLADLNGRMAAVERAYAEAHEGQAAEETKVYLRKLGEPGRVGEITFGSAGQALREQATYYDAARRDLAGIPDTPGPPTRTAAALSDRHERAASDIAGRYQENSNANLTAAFESFTPISLPVPNSGPADTPQVAWPGVDTTVSPMSVASTGPTAPPTSAAPGGVDAGGFAAAAGAGASGGAAGPGTAALNPATRTGASRGGGSAGVGLDGAGAADGSSLSRRGGEASSRLGDGSAAGGLARGSAAGRLGGGSAVGGPASLGARAGDPGSAGRPGAGGPETGRGSGLGAGGRATGPTPLRAGGDGLLGPRLPRGADGLYGSSDTGRPSRLGGSEDAAVRGRLGGSEEPGTRGRLGGAEEPGTRGRAGELGTRGLLGERVSGAVPAEEGARGGGQARQSSSHLPIVPGSAAGLRPGESRRRPAWLVEDDPEGVWLADVPPHGPPVLGRDV